MSGVSDVDVMHCRICDKKTKHESDWQSEQPNQLWIKCTECQHSETVHI